MSEMKASTQHRTGSVAPLTERAWEVAAAVLDPELPVLTIADLGILRDVRVLPTPRSRDNGAAEGTVRVTITPTYSGCPAMDTIRADLRSAFARSTFAPTCAGDGPWDVDIVTVLAPAWTTDWISEPGRDKLVAFGIAPPTGSSPAGGHSGPVRLALQVKCPHCQSLNTRELSRFGSTSCKALYVCGDCREPFDYFKVL